MKVIPVAAVAIAVSSQAITGGTSAGWASPPPTDRLEGEYIRTILSSALEWDAGRTNKVTFTPCGPRCAHWQLEDNPNGFNLYLQGDKWIRDPSEGVIMIIESVSLKGYAASTYGDVPTHQTFVLTKVGPDS